VGICRTSTGFKSLPFAKLGAARSKYIHTERQISFVMNHTNKEVLLIHRVRGLLRSGALKEEDKPIWYDVYTAFPPKYEPKYDRPAPDVPLRNIFYLEDTIRA
jgi:hypothetical protein